MNPYNTGFRVALGALGYSLIVYYASWQVALGVYVLLFNVNIDFDIVGKSLNRRVDNDSKE